MREIIFRGVEVETDKWVYGKLIENVNKEKGLLSDFDYIVPFDIIPVVEIKHTITKGGYPDFKDDDYSHCWKEREGVSISVVRVYRDSVGQYTRT